MGAVDEIATDVLLEARRRVEELTGLERELEERIRSRWEAAEAVACRRRGELEEELKDRRRSWEAEVEELRSRGEKEGRAAGFREGFARGRDEGHRLGLEQGRGEGMERGRSEGHEESTRKLENEMAGAAAALTEVSVSLAQTRKRLLAESREQLIHLAVAVARKLVKREIETVGGVALRNVEKAVELIFRRGALVVQVHPDDAVLIEKALEREPRWVEGMESIEVRPVSDVARGGCRLLSGAGTVDVTLDTQIELIEEALFAAARAAGETPPGEAEAAVKS